MSRCILAALCALAFSLPIVAVINKDSKPQPPTMAASEMLQRIEAVVAEHDPSSPSSYLAYYEAMRVGDWFCVFCDVRTMELRWKYVGPVIEGWSWNIMSQRWQRDARE